MKHRHEGKRGRRIPFLAFLALCVLSGCARDDGGKPILTGPVQMNAPAYAIGVPQGAAAMTAVEQGFPKCRVLYFQSLHDGYLAVKHKKIDAFAFDRLTLQYVAKQNPELAVMGQKIADEAIVVGCSLGREDLIQRVNAFIRQYRADGAYQDMYNRWVLRSDTKMPDLPEPLNPATTLKVGTDGLTEPMSFYVDGRLTGFDIEFTRRLALFLNAKVTISVMDFTSLIAAAETGKVDLLVASLNGTPERRQKMLFSDTYVDSEVAFLVRKDRLAPGAADQAVADLAFFSGKKVGILTGSSQEGVLKKYMPEAIPEYFNSDADQTAAVKAGKIAGFLTEEPVAREIVNNTPGVTYLKRLVRSDGYAFAFSKSRPDLQQQVNAALKELQDQGELQKIECRWFGRDEAARVLPDIKPQEQNGVIRFATFGTSPPFVYVKNGRLVGYDVEIAMRIAAKLGRRLEIIDMEFAAIIPSLISGKTDMAGGCITVTEERAESVLFSIPNYQGGVVVVVAEKPVAGVAGGGSSFRQGLRESFRRTFVVEDRYKLVLQGLWVTVVISILSAVIGTLLGFGICLMRMAGKPWANIPAKVFIRTIQGTPIIVFLMILYYIVFGNVDVHGILVAVIGFSVNFAAYASEMMRTGIEAVDKGQHEAAAALGFSRLQVFARITFPQAARHVLPVFKGEFISMVKMTSVVGYIAIQDLTKMSDIIRSRTYEAFFPLIATALIYFAIAYVMTYLMTLVEIKVDPKRRKRAVKGVVHP